MHALIMYSGGVESTALIQYAKSCDYEYTLAHLTHNVKSQNEMTACSDDVHEIVMLKPTFDKQFTNAHADVSLWLAMAMQLVGRGDFDCVWFGTHVADNHFKVKQMQTSWRAMMKILKLDCALDSPLCDRTKLDQYNMLTSEQKNSIVSCKNGINIDPCGHCDKCQEFETHVLRYI